MFVVPCHLELSTQYFHFYVISVSQNRECLVFETRVLLGGLTS